MGRTKPKSSITEAAHRCCVVELVDWRIVKPYRWTCCRWASCVCWIWVGRESVYGGDWRGASTAVVMTEALLTRKNGVTFGGVGVCFSARGKEGNSWSMVVRISATMVWASAVLLDEGQIHQWCVCGGISSEWNREMSRRCMVCGSRAVNRWRFVVVKGGWRFMVRKKSEVSWWRVYRLKVFVMVRRWRRGTKSSSNFLFLLFSFCYTVRERWCNVSGLFVFFFFYYCWKKRESVEWGERYR